MVQEIPRGNWFWRHTWSPFFPFSWQSSDLDLSVQSVYDEYFWTSSMKHLKTPAWSLQEIEVTTQMRRLIRLLGMASKILMWIVTSFPELVTEKSVGFSKETDFGNLHLCWLANNATVSLRPNMPTVLQSQLVTPWVASSGGGGRGKLSQEVRKA